jgi:adenylate cyclase
VDLLRWHDAILRHKVIEHRGTEVDHSGDGFLVSFTSPVDALRCAIDIQRSLGAHRKRAGFAPRVRMGVNTGPVTFQDGSPRGREVHLTARIMAAAGPDEILATVDLEQTAESVAGRGQTPCITAKGIEGETFVVSVPWR